MKKKISKKNKAKIQALLKTKEWYKNNQSIFFGFGLCAALTYSTGDDELRRELKSFVKRQKKGEYLIPRPWEVGAYQRRIRFIDKWIKKLENGQSL